MNRWLNRAGIRPISEGYQRRLTRQGVTEEQFRDKGFKLSKARGHSKTPEHGILSAIKDPDKYRDYLKKRPASGGTVSDRERWQTRFIANYDRNLGDYFKYNRDTVIRNAQKASIRELMLGAQTAEMGLVTLASDQRRGSIFFYH